jgi:hypothetical protein
MRSLIVLACATALSACTGTEGDVLRTPGDSSAPDASTPAWPRPEPLSSWQIQLTGTLDTSLNVQNFTCDLDSPPSVFGALHAAESLVICYFSAGTRESFRDDAEDFPEDSVGDRLPDYPDEHWVDVRDARVRAIMQARLVRAAEVGCDGIQASGLGAFAASTGLSLERADAVAFARWLSSVAHDNGLSIGLTEGDLELANELVSDFDWSLVWSCLATDCQAAAPFTARGKAAFLIEYGDESRAAEVCAQAEALGLSAIIKRDADLDVFRVGCR